MRDCYTINFSNTRNTTTFLTFSSLEEATGNFEALVHQISQVYKDKLTPGIDGSRKSVGALFLNRDSGTIWGSLWIDKLEPEFVEVVRKLGEVTVPRPRWEVKQAEWVDSDKVWSVLVEDRLTKTMNMYTMDTFDCTEKPWERTGNNTYAADVG
ncbi:hypothetical protein SLS60_000566 [Paraconiothyrium brasiliense]|uniref:Uncharacterized protein n=1 Tax=Paraconiothyrium brasiliense TaxID=300254 RepID=A0ABR3S6L3_9PLEO